MGDLCVETTINYKYRAQSFQKVFDLNTVKKL